MPTYNGAETIEKAIESVLSQVGPDKIGLVEVVVSDNASNDETGPRALRLLSRYPGRVRYHRNETNIGFDANVDAVVHLAKGRFVWLLADNDYLKDGAVDEVLRAIREHPEVALMFANFEGGSARLSLEEGELCPDGNAFFTRINFKNGLVSSNIVNRRIWLDLDLRRYYGCHWIHFAYAMKALSPNIHRQAFILKGTPLDYGDAKARWGGRGSFIFVGLSLVDVFREMPRLGYSRGVKKRGDFVIKAGYPKYIPLAKAQGLCLDGSLLNSFYSHYRRYPTFWAIDLPLLLIPGWFYRLLFDLRSRGRNVRGRMDSTNDDLQSSPP
jgi:glycosyltransferase involved in cell wall biosynthesis